MPTTTEKVSSAQFHVCSVTGFFKTVCLILQTLLQALHIMENFNETEITEQGYKIYEVVYNTWW